MPSILTKEEILTNSLYPSLFFAYNRTQDVKLSSFLKVYSNPKIGLIFASLHAL